MVDLPYRNGIPTRWNYRPGSAARPFIFAAVLYGSVYGYLIWGEKLALSFYIGATIIFIAILVALKVPQKNTTTKQP